MDVGERIVTLNSNQIKNKKPRAYADGGGFALGRRAPTGRGGPSLKIRIEERSFCSKLFGEECERKLLRSQRYE
jgi:hypothetical protein